MQPRQQRAEMLLFGIGIEMLAGPAKPINLLQFLHGDCDPSWNLTGRADLRFPIPDGYSESSASLLAVVVTEIGTYSHL
ncbi:hypothetical protein CA54_36790 [Symmachiella macrocystis]|uniref:Uncharacterized protein n=1 Tax=Symmachiella macrocystis TaxID=2527985 RepID=A0A5C6BRF9_9PLAN|nr:hypothetical protein CA54_36790 [Symmachiella macrocystis]